MAIWTKQQAQNAINQANQLQNQGMAGGGVAGQYYQGGSILGTAPMYDPEKEALRSRVHALEVEVRSFDGIRAMDRALLQRHYRMWQWLKDVHPEVVAEFDAMEDLLKASGEKF